MELPVSGPRSERRISRHWISATLAILSAVFTTWALYVTQETWHPSVIADREGRQVTRASNLEIEALEAELVRIQERLHELRSGTRP